MLLALTDVVGICPKADITLRIASQKTKKRGALDKGGAVLFKGVE